MYGLEVQRTKGRLVGPLELRHARQSKGLLSE